MEHRTSFQYDLVRVSMRLMESSPKKSPRPKGPPAAPPNLQERQWYKRLDFLSLFALVLGSLILVILWLLLALVWAQSIAWSTEKEPWAFWSRVVRLEWTSRFVTICTAAMRSIIALQASITSAMGAALMLEDMGVPLQHAPYYSAVRALYPSPSALLQIQALQIRDKWTGLTVGLIFIETAVAIAPQFLSTLYLSDMSIATVLDETIMQMVPIIDNNGFISSPWTSSPSLSWRFAELSDGLTQGTNFHDTGHTYRAFLPFEDEHLRLSLREYLSPVQVMNQRVVCTSPSLTDPVLSGMDYANFKEQLELDEYYSARDQDQRPIQTSIKFRCQIHRNMARKSLCYLFNPGGLGQKPENETEISPITIEVILVFNEIEQWLQPNITNEPIVVTKRIGPWTYIGKMSDVSLLPVAACSFNLGTSPFYIHLSSALDGIELSVSWNNEQRNYNTDPIRYQLEASLNSSPPQDRGLLSIQPRAEWQDANNMTNYLPWHDDGIWSRILEITILQISSTENSVILDPYAINPIHRAHIELFHDVINSTNSPALAVQALFARLCSIIYYDRIPSRAYEMGPAYVRLSIGLLMPVTWSGFISASCIIATHMFVVETDAILFFQLTKCSVLGNCWHAIAQVSAVETAPILREGNRMVDKEVERWAKSQLIELKPIVTLQENGYGRIALRTKARDEELVTEEPGVAAPD